MLLKKLLDVSSQLLDGTVRRTTRISRAKSCTKTPWLELKMYGCSLCWREGRALAAGGKCDVGGREQNTRKSRTFFVVDEAGTPGLVFLRNFLCIVLCV
jgi:hypothetical protein